MVLQVAPEEQVCAMVMAWAASCDATLTSGLSEVWPHVRWPLMPLADLQASKHGYCYKQPAVCAGHH